MQKFLIIILFMSVFFLAGYFGMGVIDDKYFKGKVLSELSEKVPDTPASATIPAPAPTTPPTSTPTTASTPTPKPTKVPTATPIPQPKVTSAEIHGFMERFSGQYGVDVNVLRHLAVCESGFNPSAISGPYGGLYQFNITTWKNNRILMGEDIDPNLRFNAEESVQTAAFLISMGKRYLWPNCYP